MIALEQVHGCSEATTWTSPYATLLLSKVVQYFQIVNSIWNSEQRRLLGPLELKMVESSWRELYRAAILELDPKRLQARVKAAEDAIQARASGEARVSRDERREMNDASSTLRVLKRKLP